MSYRILQPITVNWRTFEFVYSVLQEEVVKAKNFTMQDLYIYDKDKELYKKLVSKFPISQTGNLSTSQQEAFKKYTSSKYDIKNCNISLPTFKSTNPIDFHKHSIKINKIEEKADENIYSLCLSFISNKGLPIINKKIDDYNDELVEYVKDMKKKDEEKEKKNEEKDEDKCKKNKKDYEEYMNKHKVDKIEQKRFEFQISAPKGTQLDIMERCLNGEYNICASQLVLRTDKIEKKIRHRFYFNLCYNFETKESVLDPKRVMGIDIGCNTPAYLAFNFNKYIKNEKIDDDAIYKIKKEINGRLSRLKHSRKFALSGSVGHGRATLMKAKSKLNHCAYNLQKTKDHNWSRYIVDTALKYGCGTIAMENLSHQVMKKNSDKKVIKVHKKLNGGLRDETEKDDWLRNWAIYQFQHDIEYKAREEGLYVVYVDPYQTSQKCNECGYVDEGNRPKVNEKGKADSSYFKCKKCGHKDNADFNAAKNIAELGEIEINKVLN